MFKSKLFDLLGSLDDSEYKRFGEFAASTYFNKSKLLVKLLLIYKKFHPDFRGDKFTKVNIFAKLLPGKTFNESLLRNYNSDLLSLAEEYLTYLNIKRNSRNHYKHLLNELNLRGINSLFKSNYDSAMNDLEGSAKRDTLYHYDRYFIKQEKEYNNSIVKEFSKEDMYDSESSIINFLFSVMLEMYAFNINQIEVHKAKYDFILLDELIKLVELKKDLLNPVVLMHYNRLMLHYTGDEKYYSILKEQAETQGSLSETENHFDTYICLINYVKKHKDMEQIETIRELFDLRKIIIEKYILAGKNYISQNIFLSQLRSGIKLKEFDWVHSFIETYKNSLPEKVKNNTYHYSLAVYYFNIGLYKEALLNITLLTGNTFEPLEVKNLTTRIYWQLNDFDMISSSLVLYKQNIAKNRNLDKDIKKKHSAFIIILDKLFKCKYDGKEIDLNRLRKEADSKTIINNKWLIDVIDSLKK